MTNATQQLDGKISNVMESITQSVIDAIAAGTAPWQRPWENRFNATWPTNPTTDRAYNGMNALYLMMLAEVEHDGCPYWMGYKQAQKKGGHVRKGEKSTEILAPIMKKGEDANGREYMFPVGFRIVRVFNAKQCDGLNLPELEPREPRTLDANALDAFALATGANINHAERDRACFIPSQDRIEMPLKDQFKTEGGYYGTLLHELIHWTGHKSRIDRLDTVNRRGYAFEELIAELGAFYASEVIGCPNEAENHAPYLESWLKAFEGDVQYLWQAASAAERAAKYLIACAEKGGHVMSEAA